MHKAWLLIVFLIFKLITQQGILQFKNASCHQTEQNCSNCSIIGVNSIPYNIGKLA